VALVTDKNAKALDRMETQYSVEVYPTVFFDGGHSVQVGVPSGETGYRTKIQAAGARTAPPLDLVARVKFNSPSDIRVYISIGNETPANVAPAVPVILSGPVSGQPGETYNISALAVDPDADSLFYQFAWGDGDTSLWLGPYGSAVEMSTGHSWSSEGEFEVRCRVRDVWQTTSGWSAPLAVGMSSSCCVGPSVGNLDGSADNLVTMGDLTVLIDHLFISFNPLACVDEGNVDLSADGLVTMGDLTVLIDHLFISFNPLSACP
jgi:hypothetical protein